MNLKLIPNQHHRWIVAHRGASNRFPESTQAAFEGAIVCNAEAIECDLQLTVDNEIVVCHDPTLERYGHPYIRVSESTLPDLQTLDIGSWFAPEFRDQRLLSLDELLLVFGHRTVLYLEVKTDKHSPQRTGMLLRKLLDAIVSHRLQEQVAILCFDSDTLRRVRELAVWATLVLNANAPDGIGEADLRSQPWLNGVDAHIEVLNARIVQTLHERGLTSLCFSCDSEESVLKAWDLGADGLITNDPERTRGILQQHGRLGHAS